MNNQTKNNELQPKNKIIQDKINNDNILVEKKKKIGQKTNNNDPSQTFGPETKNSNIKIEQSNKSQIRNNKNDKVKTNIDFRTIPNFECKNSRKINHY